MKIESNKFYAIICFTKNKEYILHWYNNKIYRGKDVLKGWKYLKDKDNYKIYEITDVQEVLDNDK